MTPPLIRAPLHTATRPCLAGSLHLRGGRAVVRHQRTATCNARGRCCMPLHLRTAARTYLPDSCARVAQPCRLPAARTRPHTTCPAPPPPATPTTPPHFPRLAFIREDGQHFSPPAHIKRTLDVWMGGVGGRWWSWARQHCTTVYASRTACAGTAPHALPRLRDVAAVPAAGTASPACAHLPPHLART